MYFEIAGPVVYSWQKGRPVCSTHCAQKKLMHTIASWIRNQCHFSSSAECFEFVRTSFFTHKSFDHYSLTQKQQSACSIPTSCLMVSLYLFPGGYIENPIFFKHKIRNVSPYYLSRETWIHKETEKYHKPRILLNHFLVWNINCLWIINVIKIRYVTYTSNEFLIRSKSILFEATIIVKCIVKIILIQ